MIRLAIWLLAAIFLISGLLLLFLLLKNRAELSFSTVWTLGDFLQLAGVVLNVIALAIAIGALQVALTAFRENREASQKQRAALDTSMQAMESVVETAQSQQEMLQANLAVSQAQLGLLEQQAQQHVVRKPLVELYYDDFKVNELRAPVRIAPGRDWTRISLLARNKGNEPAQQGTVVVIAEPRTILIDEANHRVANRRNHHRFQTALPDLLPYSETHDDFLLELDLHGPIPDDFTLSFSVFGENFEAVRSKIAFRTVQ